MDPTPRVWFHAFEENSMKPLRDRGSTPELFAAELRAAFGSLRASLLSDKGEVT